MAGQQAPKAQPDVVDLAPGSAAMFSVPEEQRALAELLLLRCGGVDRLIGSQMLEQAKLCGQAVRAAFDELYKASEPQE